MTLGNGLSLKTLGFAICLSYSLMNPGPIQAQSNYADTCILDFANSQTPTYSLRQTCTDIYTLGSDSTFVNPPLTGTEVDKWGNYSQTATKTINVRLLYVQYSENDPRNFDIGNAEHRAFLDCIFGPYGSLNHRLANLQYQAILNDPTAQDSCYFEENQSFTPPGTLNSFSDAKIRVRIHDEFEIHDSLLWDGNKYARYMGDSLIFDSSYVQNLGIYDAYNNHPNKPKDDALLIFFIGSDSLYRKYILGDSTAGSYR